LNNLITHPLCSGLKHRNSAIDWNYTTCWWNPCRGWPGTLCYSGLFTRKLTRKVLNKIWWKWWDNNFSMLSFVVGVCVCVCDREDNFLLCVMGGGTSTHCVMYNGEDNYSLCCV